MKTWKNGPPPSLGWWPASFVQNEDTLRWWDGNCWSMGANKRHTAEQAAQFASVPAESGLFGIEWTERPDNWPEHSRA